MRTWLGVQPWSAGAFALGLAVVVAASAIEALLLHLGVGLYFAAFLPAVFLAGLFAGVPAASLVVVVAVPLVWWAFMPPHFEFNSLRADDVESIRTFLLVGPLLVFLGDGCRAIIALRGARGASRND